MTQPTIPLTASRALDALVAERVMGWRRGTIGYADDPSQVWFPDGPDGYWTEEMVPYSTSIAAAWTVHEHCCAQLFSKRMAYLDALAEQLQTTDPEGRWREAWQSCLRNLSPLAICLAALKAVE